MADREEELAEKALNKLEEFHKKQKEIEWDRRRKRNAEVDQLISQLGDPKVAEKLRIYRLVEEQFNHIEIEIEKQVKAELEAKRKHQKPSEPNTKLHTNSTKNPGNVLARARKMRMELAKELENENPPEPIKDNLAKVRAERQAEAKERLLRRSEPKIRGPIEKTVQKAPKILSIPTSKLQIKCKPKSDPNADQIIMHSKPIIRDITANERRNIYDNVGFVAYEYAESEGESKKVLSAHMLGGINIAPYAVPVQLTRTVKTAIIEELHESHTETEENVKIDLQSKQNEGQMRTPEQNTAKAELSEGPLDESSPMLESRQAYNIEVSEDQIDCKVEEIDEYSDNFEEDDENNENTEEILKEFAPKIAAMQEFTDDSLTDRLSTIPEVPSQATSVEEFHKLMEHSSDSSSASKSSSLITSPIRVIKPNQSELSEGPLDESLPMQESRQPAKTDLSEGPLDESSPMLDSRQPGKIELSEGPLNESSPMLEPRQLDKIELSEGSLEVSPMLDLRQHIKNQRSEGLLDDSSPMLEPRDNKPDHEHTQTAKIELSEGPLGDSSPKLDTLPLPMDQIQDESNIDISEGPIVSEDSLEQLSLSEGPISGAVDVSNPKADPSVMTKADQDLSESEKKSSSTSLMASSSASLTTCSSLSKSENLSEGQFLMSVELSEGEVRHSSDSLDE